MKNCATLALLTVTMAVLGLACQPAGRTEPAGADPPAGNEPQLLDVANSGCLNAEEFVDAVDDAPDDYPGCEAQDVTFTVAGDTVEIVHTNAVYNCCAADIEVAMVVEGTNIDLTETEVEGDPCDCLCCYNVESTVADLDPGQYTLEYCWGEAEDECRAEEVEIG